MKQGLEDANKKLNELFDHLNPSMMQGSGSTVALGTVQATPTRTITLAGQFKLSFTENDVPRVPSKSFANDFDSLNAMWDDTSIHWKGDSALIVKTFPIAITYWKQMYTSKNGK